MVKANEFRIYFRACRKLYAMGCGPMKPHRMDLVVKFIQVFHRLPRRIGEGNLYLTKAACDSYFNDID